MDTQEVRDFIDEMIDVLREDGWCQDVFHSPTGAHCIRGASEALKSRSRVWSRDAVAGVVYGHLQRTAMLYGCQTVPEFNDDICTCEDDAVRFLKDAKESL